MFNPYSGVKTSILILDRAVAKASDSVAFFKIENDGFGLGAQRRAVKGSQLPQVKAELGAWLAVVRGGGDAALESSLGHAVEKARITDGGEYNLSGERYRGSVQHSAHWPMATVGGLCEIARGASPRPIQDFMTTAPDGVNWIKIGDAQIGSKFIRTTKEKVSPEGAKKSRYVKPGDFILSNSMSFGRPYIMATDGCIHDGWLLLRPKTPDIDQDFLYQILGSQPVYEQFVRQATGGVVNNLNSSIVAAVQIPLPPLEVQREIVAEIEGYQKVIDGARAVLENYRPHIPIDPAWPMAELGDLCSFASGGTPSKANDAYWIGQIPWVSAKDLKIDQIYDAGLHVSDAAVVESATQIAPVGSLLVLVRGMGLANGVPICEVMVPCTFNQDLKALLPDAEIVQSRFLAFALRQQEVYFRKVLETAAHGTLKLNSDALRQTKIPLPPLETQQAVVAEIEAEQALVAANRELVARFETKIESAIARVWGEANAALGSEDAPATQGELEPA